MLSLGLNISGPSKKIWQQMQAAGDVKIIDLARLIVLGLIGLSFIFATIGSYTCSTSCYFSDLEIVSMAIGWHIVLFILAFFVDKVTLTLILMLTVFFWARFGQLQINPSVYYYPLIKLSTKDILNSLIVCSWISLGLISGSMTGAFLGKAGATHYLGVFPFENRIGNISAFYLRVCYLVIVLKSIQILLFVATGVGLPIPKNNFAIWPLRAAKVSNFFSFLGIVPIIWLIVGSPKGWTRVSTVIAVILHVISVVMLLSKTALIYAIVPFMLVFFICRAAVPWRFIVAVAATLMLSVFAAASLLAKLRIQIATFFTKSSSLDMSSVTFSISDAVLGFFNRVGSSFDALVGVVHFETELAKHTNILAEFLDVLNGYVKIFNSTVPPWSQLLPHIMNNANLDYLLNIAKTGENIGAIPHIYLYFGLMGGALAGFIIMFLIAYWFYRTSSILIRVLLLHWIFFGISNGGGFLDFAAIIHYVGWCFVLIYLTLSFKVRTHLPSSNSSAKPWALNQLKGAST